MNGNHVNWKKIVNFNQTVRASKKASETVEVIFSCLILRKLVTLVSSKIMQVSIEYFACPQLLFKSNLFGWIFREKQILFKWTKSRSENANRLRRIPYSKRFFVDIFAQVIFNFPEKHSEIFTSRYTQSLLFLSSLSWTTMLWNLLCKRKAFYRSTSTGKQVFTSVRFVLALNFHVTERSEKKMKRISTLRWHWRITEWKSKKKLYTLFICKIFLFPAECSALGVKAT